MADNHASSINSLLASIEQGDRDAFNALYNLVYSELKRLAAIQRARWNGDFTLNTTALVHEAYEKLVSAKKKKWEDKTHFYRVAAKAMRQILYTYAEGKQAYKRGGNIPQVSLDDQEIADGFLISEDRLLEVISMEQAMKKLEEISPREAAITEYRYYLGLSIEETAQLMGIGTATVKRGWAMAKAWLYRELTAAS